MGTRNDIAHAADMAVFDRLPAELRQALAASPYPARAGEIEALLGRLVWTGVPPPQAARMIVVGMPGAWEDNLTAFAHGYLRRYGVPLPHVAAGASFLVEGAPRLPRPPARGMSSRRS